MPVSKQNPSVYAGNIKYRQRSLFLLFLFSPAFSQTRIDLPRQSQAGALLNLRQGAQLELVFQPRGGYPAGLQWTITYRQSDITALSVTAGPAATAAGKSVQCNASGGVVTCLLTGIDTNAIRAGVVATVSVTFASGVNVSVIGIGGRLGRLGATLGGDLYPVAGDTGLIVTR